MQVHTTNETYAKFGFYDGDPNNGDDVAKHGANFGWGNNGVLLMTEVGYKTADGLWSMPSRYSFGGYVHTGDFPDVARESPSAKIFSSVVSPVANIPARAGFILLFEQMLLRNANRPETGLNGFVTFVVSPDEDKSPIPFYLNGVIDLRRPDPLSAQRQDGARILFGLVQQLRS